MGNKTSQEHHRDVTPTLSPIPAEQAEAYSRHRNALVEAVNAALLARSDLPELLGGSPVESMVTNHYNHAAFLATVMRLGNFALLAKTLSWVYRAYHNQGFTYEYFLVELDAWMDAIQRILPPPVDGILAVYRWIRDQHEENIRRSQKPAPEVEPDDPAWKPTCADFTRALLAGDVVACLHQVHRLVQDAQSMLDFFTYVLQPALYNVGIRWENGSITVAQEHLASAIAARILATVPAASFAPPGVHRGTAVVSASANEFHEIGAWMVAAALESDGWDVCYLGANTPRQDLVDFVRHVQPRLLCLSVVMPFNLEGTRHAIAELRQDPATRQVAILVGGQAILHDTSVVHILGADAFTATCREARQVARELAP